MKSLISIIIPTYNRAHLIGETLDSIIAQTYQNWECIVVDDRSTDNTEVVLEEYLKKDTRIFFYKKPNDMPKGPSASRNYGLKLARGTYINFLDSDDLMVSTKLETDLDKLLSGDYDFTISQSKFFYPSGIQGKTYWNKNLFSGDPLNDFILKKIGWSINSPLWKKESIQSENLLFDEFLITGDDYFYHIEALQKNLKPIVYDYINILLRGEGVRLNNFHNKTPFKLKINFRLLTEQRFNLSSEVLEKLKKVNYRLIGSSFKKKDYKTALDYIYKFFLLDRSFENIGKLSKLLFFGTFYQITSKGYSLINKIV